MAKKKAIKHERFEGETIWTGTCIAFTHQGFDIEAVADYDEHADLDYLGTFSDTPGVGAVDHHATGKWLDRSHQGEHYFNPANYDLDFYITHEKKSEEEAKAECDRIACQDYERIVGYCTGDWNVLGVVLTVSRDGVKLASASLWNIESDSGAGYFNSVVEDLLHEAMIEAKQKLNLLASFAESVQ